MSLNTQVIRNNDNKVIYAVNMGVLADGETKTVKPYGATHAYRKVATSTLVLSNSTSQVLSFEPGAITDLSLMSGPGQFTLSASNGQTETYVFRPSDDVSLSNIQVVTIAGAYTLPANTYGVLVEGLSLTITSNALVNVYIGNTAHQVDTNTSIQANTKAAHYSIPASQHEVTIAGDGKIVTFNV